ncbi:hypothetical protein NK983_25305, partial [Salmonella enterica subsp. enterica serovar Typhimurium]|nr:hypothetical protein [Salmonella enterica subsp. enterica serovar Typhimurium]
LPDMPPAVLEALERFGPLYMDIRGRVVLAFCPQRELEDAQHTEMLVTLATALADHSAVT